MSKYVMLHVEIQYFNEEGVKLQESKFDTHISKETIIIDTQKKAVAKDSHLYKLKETILRIWKDGEFVYLGEFDRHGLLPNSGQID